MTTSEEAPPRHPILNATGVKSGWGWVFATFMIVMIILGLFWLFTAVVLRGFDTYSIHEAAEDGPVPSAMAFFAVSIVISWLFTLSFFRWYVMLLGTLLVLALAITILFIAAAL